MEEYACEIIHGNDTDGSPKMKSGGSETDMPSVCKRAVEPAKARKDLDVGKYDDSEEDEEIAREIAAVKVSECAKDEKRIDECEGKWVGQRSNRVWGEGNSRRVAIKGIRFGKGRVRLSAASTHVYSGGDTNSADVEVGFPKTADGIFGDRADIGYNERGESDDMMGRVDANLAPRTFLNPKIQNQKRTKREKYDFDARASGYALHRGV